MSGQVGGLGEARGARSAESAESRKSKSGASLCECGYPHADYCGGELCDVCEACGSKTACDECAGEERDRDLERAELLAEEDRLLYGI